MRQCPSPSFFLLFCFVFFFFFPLFFSLILHRPLFLSLSLFFFSSRRRLFTLSLALSVIFSLTHSLLHRLANLSVALSPPKSSPTVTLSPSSNTPTGILLASPLISSPQLYDLLSCYHSLIPLLSLETLTNSCRVKVLFALFALRVSKYIQNRGKK
jgi:hypothetical protein